jgi:hypothetical protein
MEHNSNFEKWSTNNIFLLIPVIGIVLPVGKHSESVDKSRKQVSRQAQFKGRTKSDVNWDG